MKTLMRTLTLSAAALAALMSIAPKADAQDWSRGQRREARPFRGETFRGGEFRGHEFRGGEFRGREFRGGETFRGRGFRGGEFRGGETFRGREFRGGGTFRGREFRERGFFRPPAFFGRGPISPFRVFAGSRFFSYCPGPDYIYVDDLGWVFPPFDGAAWMPAHFDRFGVEIGGCWR